MPRPQPVDCSSSDEDEQTDIESCFDADGDSNPDTTPTDVNTDIEEDNETDLLWLYRDDEDHPPEYYLEQEDDFNESEFANEDYGDKSTNLLDGMKERWDR
jgi:hypothetical protein